MAQQGYGPGGQHPQYPQQGYPAGPHAPQGMPPQQPGYPGNPSNYPQGNAPGYPPQPGYGPQPGAYPPPPVFSQPPKSSGAGTGCALGCGIVGLIGVATVIAIVIVVFTLAGLIEQDEKNRNGSSGAQSAIPTTPPAPSPVTDMPTTQQVEKISGFKSDAESDRNYAHELAYDQPTKIVGSGNKCLETLNSSKEWLPGGWTFHCVTKIPGDKREKLEGTGENWTTQGYTQSHDGGTKDSPTLRGDIYVRNDLTAKQTQSTLVHELAHAYADIYMTSKTRKELAQRVGKKKFYADPKVEYIHNPNEIWARSFSKCLSGYDDEERPLVSCETVDEFIHKTEKENYLNYRLRVDLDYRQGRTPEYAMNNRKISG